MKITGIILLILMSIVGYSQQDSLVLFTKKGCSNCAYAKETLFKHKINFIEKEVENKSNAKKLLIQLKKIGYDGRIYMPVIFLNNEIYHPVCDTDTSLTRIPLKKAIDSIIFLYEAGLITPIEAVNKKNNTDEVDGNCEMSYKQIYLIGENFKTKKEATVFANKLKDEGYINSGFLFYQNYYRVYYDVYIDEQKAEEELKKLRQQDKIAYLFYKKE